MVLSKSTLLSVFHICHSASIVNQHKEQAQPELKTRISKFYWSFLWYKTPAVWAGHLAFFTTCKQWLSCLIHRLQNACGKSTPAITHRIDKLELTYILLPGLKEAQLGLCRRRGGQIKAGPARLERLPVAAQLLLPRRRQAPAAQGADRAEAQ